ncbi:NUDIX domain-containing protein [Bacillus suaedaesalsae]|uniref:NUDIX domain-containing protein n=1 Tax=Bacillus suaedaesalsae TaxID=2810349 RepID=A0ABS2DIN0_9BACI|nr:NUDIX domain-containing protein [Bacillus suaedaesalsae]
MRNRGSAVIIQNGKVALIKRTKSEEVYYVFPGGGVEEGESPEEATIREVKEELGVRIENKYLLATVQFQGIQYFYVADITSGIFGTGEGEEFSDPSRGRYEPTWVEITALSSLEVKPKQIVKLIQTLT